jgi:FG-GAP repeat
MKKQLYSLLLLLPLFAQAQNVGIGTTTPTEKLEIKNPLKSTVKISSDGFNDTAQLILSNRDNSNQGTDFLITARREQGVFFSSTSDLVGNSKDSLFSILTGGNVGVGIKTPAYRMQLHNPALAGPTYLNITNAATGSTTGNGLLMGMALTTAKLNNLENGNLELGTNNISHVAINPTGNVGVGNLIPAYKLDVSGDINLTGAMRVNGNNGTTGQVLTSSGTSAPTWTDATSTSGASNVGFGPWGNCGINNISEYNPVADASGAQADDFGRSVSISGNYAIVGAKADDVGANNDQGSVSFYQFIGANWVFMQKITDATGAQNDRFGNSVSISGNYAIVGIPGDAIGANLNQGSANIYQLTGGSWVLMQKIIDATGAADDAFGSSVSISGNYAIVGSPFDDGGAGANQGSASIYQLSGGTWVLMQKITDATGAANDNFGNSVSISGNYIIVGAEDDDVGAFSDVGSASIYQWNGSSWIIMSKIVGYLSINPFDNFGNSVSISGNYAIVGSKSDDVITLNQGSADFFQWNGSSWIFMQEIFDLNGATDENFGYSVFISGDYAIVGTPFDWNGTSRGSTNIYQRIGNGWGKLQFVTDPMGLSDNFGSSTALDGITKRFLIGAPSYGEGSGKVVFGKIN